MFNSFQGETEKKKKIKTVTFSSIPSNILFCFSNQNALFVLMKGKQKKKKGQ